MIADAVKGVSDFIDKTSEDSTALAKIDHTEKPGGAYDNQRQRNCRVKAFYPAGSLPPCLE